MGWNVSANECWICIVEWKLNLGCGWVEEWAESWKWIPQSQMFLLRRNSFESFLQPDASMCRVFANKTFLSSLSNLIDNEHKVLSYVNIMHKLFASQGVVWLVCHQSAVLWFLSPSCFYSRPLSLSKGYESLIHYSDDRLQNAVSDSINISIFSRLFFVSNSSCSN